MANEDKKEQNELTKEHIDLLKTLNKLMKEQNDALKGTADNAKKAGDAVTDALSSLEKTGEGLGDTLGGFFGMGSGLSKTMQNLVSDAGKAKNGFEAFDIVTKGFTKSLTSNFNAMSIGISVLEKMFEATVALTAATDSALVSFQKQTGTLSLYSSKIIALESQNYQFGISIDEAAESQASLVMNIRNFNTLGDETQSQLLRTTAILNEMGVDSSLTAQSLNFMTNSLGMTADQADQTTREMFVLAKSMGMPPQEMAESFNAAQPQLAAFGNRANQVFQKLAINARSATMEVADMLRIAEQFDRFDTAAASVGKLNAALGGPYLSTIRMVTTTDPTERIKMLSDAARQAGKSFDSMDYFERKVIASAMGLKDVNELALVMRNRFDLVAGSTQKSAADIEKLAQQTKDYNTIMEEFSQLMREFAINIAGPIISFFKNMIQFVQNLTSTGLPALIVGVLGTAAAAGILWSAIGGPIGPIVGAIVLLIGALAVLGKAVYDLLARSKPFMDVFGPFWEKLTTKISEFGEKASPVFSNFQKFIDEAIVEMMPAIEMAFNHILKSVDILLTSLGKMNTFFSDIGLYSGIMEGFAFVFQIVTAIVIGAVQAFSALAAAISSLLTGDLQGLYHMLFIGNSPSLIEVFGILGSAITSVGDALMWPIEMVMKLMTGLRDLAGLLAGKALSFISGAISYVFGGSPEAEVNNGGFNRKEDMESMSVSIGEEVAKAVKEALQDVQMNNKVQLEVVSQNGLPTLFDFVQRGMDDSQAGRSPQHSLNAARAGIGKA